MLESNQGFSRRAATNDSVAQIPEVYTPLLERLLVVQIDSYPQYSERMQSACGRAILKVLAAMASKGPVLWSFISSVGELTFQIYI